MQVEAESQISKLDKSLKIPIFFTDGFMSGEQAKFKAQKAADANFMREDYDKAQNKFDKAQG